MLTRQQLQRIAQREHIGLQAQERDYIQNLLLAHLYNRNQSLVFKGGTALRLIHKGARYSEDLDFNAYDEVAALQQLWADVVSDLRLYGVEAESREAWQGDVGYSFDVSYRGPLFDGRDRTKGKVRIDMSLRRESVETRRDLVNPIYDDIRPFVVTALTPEHLVAEKVRALLTRSKPRDLYDLWLMQNKGWRVDWLLVGQKLALYQLTYSPELLNKALEALPDDWERDMRPLLSQFVPFEDVRRSVEGFLKQL